MKRARKIISFFCLSGVLCVSLAAGVKALSKEQEYGILQNYLWNDCMVLPQEKRPRIALVLGGGGARGLAHIGVLKVLENENIPIDMVIGTSVGSIIGALYCAGVSIDEIEKLGENIGWDNLTDFSAGGIVKLLVAERLLSTEKMERYLEKLLGKKRFEDLDIPFACVATDIRTGEKIIFKEGDVVQAVRASSTIPGVFSPVEYRHRFLVDGGLVDNLPTDVAKMMGAEIIIAVPVEAEPGESEYRNVLEILNQAIYIQGQVIVEQLVKSADVVIKPMVKDIAIHELWKSKECVEAGEIAARKKVDEMRQVIINRTFTLYYSNKKP